MLWLRASIGGRYAQIIKVEHSKRLVLARWLDVVARSVDIHFVGLVHLGCGAAALIRLCARNPSGTVGLNTAVTSLPAAPIDMNQRGAGIGSDELAIIGAKAQTVSTSDRRGGPQTMSFQQYNQISISIS